MPQDDATPQIGFPCPRCAETFLEPSAFGRATIKVCKQCHGCFVPALQFTFIINDYLDGIELPLGSLPPPPPRKKAGNDPKLERVICIACKRDMDRFNFASRSGAIVDVCSVHGIWLDGGELVPILHYVKTRNELGEVPRSQAEIDEENASLKALVESTERLRAIDAELGILHWRDAQDPFGFGWALDKYQRRL